MVNATWMAARPQWYFWSIGLTNKVQPYCRLAIITMQMMPKMSWPQRVASDATGRADAPAATVIIGLLLTILLFCFAGFYKLPRRFCELDMEADLFASTRRLICAVPKPPQH